ncbi:hypothetical protein BC826DRAFT_659405 [Russula brevipes]|nr:hypothetical protein BC826DRAFT_659405 [Russula brevipes]
MLHFATGHDFTCSARLIRHTSAQRTTLRGGPCPSNDRRVVPAYRIIDYPIFFVVVVVPWLLLRLGLRFTFDPATFVSPYSMLNHIRITSGESISSSMCSAELCSPGKGGSRPSHRFFFPSVLSVFGSIPYAFISTSLD